MRFSVDVFVKSLAENPVLIKKVDEIGDKFLEGSIGYCGSSTDFWKRFETEHNRGKCYGLIPGERFVVHFITIRQVGLGHPIEMAVQLILGKLRKIDFLKNQQFLQKDTMVQLWFEGFIIVYTIEFFKSFGQINLNINNVCRANK
jgi:hypothetical protein